MYTDASGGYGALYGTKWFCGQRPRTWLPYNITVLEFFPIVAAVTVWGHDWSNHSVCFITDNEALVTLSVLVEASLAPSSWQQYVRSWDKYFSFCQLVGASAELPTPVSLILLFIVHIFYHGSAPSSVVSAVSAISYFKLTGFQTQQIVL